MLVFFWSSTSSRRSWSCPSCCRWPPCLLHVNATFRPFLRRKWFPSAWARRSCFSCVLPFLASGRKCCLRWWIRWILCILRKKGPALGSGNLGFSFFYWGGNWKVRKFIYYLRVFVVCRVYILGFICMAFANQIPLRENSWARISSPKPKRSPFLIVPRKSRFSPNSISSVI